MSKSTLVLIVITVIAAIIDWRIALGILIGYLFSLLHSGFLKVRFGNLTSGGVKLRVYLGLLVSFMIFACPMLIAMLLPQYVHFIGVFIGLMFPKYAMYVQVFKK